MIDKKWLENLLYEKHSLTRTVDIQTAINEIMENLDTAVEVGLERAKRSEKYDYLEELLRVPGAELMLNHYTLVWNKFEDCWTILDFSGETEEIYKNNIDLKNALEYMTTEE